MTTTLPFSDPFLIASERKEYSVLKKMWGHGRETTQSPVEKLPQKSVTQTRRGRGKELLSASE